MLHQVTRSLELLQPIMRLRVIHKNGGAFKYPMLFQRDNELEFKSDVTRLLEKTRY